jgi:hypothetical protein
MVKRFLKHVEEWDKVPGFNSYVVSTHGRVMNNKTGRILTNQIKDGYNTVNITNDEGKRKHMLLHRLVAIAFLSNPKNGKCVDHKDRDPNNNHVSNLRWCSISQNQMNKTKYKNNSSGVTGIHYDEDSEKYVVRIQKNSKMHDLGSYNTLRQAKNVRLKAIKEKFGEFANTEELN